MEFLIVFIAAALAGIGTGLVGLSAATAMVPLLIVLCPTFQGAHGAYMATAIALASDILGSAVTTMVYARNKNIDLKHGWLVTVCIISMCTIGSIAAYFTHQQVLGTFSLILCVGIGIRFLVKPDSSEKRSSTSAKLTPKEIALSLFFGLSTGFGTGYFGSGGGMMMLIIFTAMLGYDRKTAVGTSTFIMTFTALIASISHMMIEPAIIYQCWQHLILSIVVATIFSMVSARFANRVNNRVVSLVTGTILFVLGLVLIFLNNLDRMDMALVMETLRLTGIYWGYIILLAIGLILLRFLVRVPDYIFRKLLHVVAFTSILPLVFCTSDWRAAALTEILFLIVVILALYLAENLSFYSSLLVEKGKHEVLTSFVLLFSLMTILLAVFWGFFGEGNKYIIVAAIMAWGPGDAAAAIVGRNWGRHKLTGKHIEGTKSVEGTVAMGITSFICTLATLLLLSGLEFGMCLALSCIIAPIAAVVELETKHGMDTITVPIVSALILTAAIFL